VAAASNDGATGIGRRRAGQKVTLNLRGPKLKVTGGSR